MIQTELGDKALRRRFVAKPIVSEGLLWKVDTELSEVAEFAGLTLEETLGMAEGLEAAGWFDGDAGLWLIKDTDGEIGMIASEVLHKRFDEVAE